MPLLLRRYRCCRCSFAACNGCCRETGTIQGTCCYARGAAITDEIVGLFVESIRDWQLFSGGIEIIRVTQTAPSILVQDSGTQCHFEVPCHIYWEYTPPGGSPSSCEDDQVLTVKPGLSCSVPSTKRCWEEPKGIDASQFPCRFSAGYGTFCVTGRPDDTCDLVDTHFFTSGGDQEVTYQLAVAHRVQPCVGGDCQTCT